MGNEWGKYFKVTTFGESHGPAVGCVIDGVPAGVAIDVSVVAEFLKRRRPGQNALTSPRVESDEPKILSGVFNGKSLGSPIAIVVENFDARPQDYSKTRDILRPSHADYTYLKKYGSPLQSGSGRASARETIGRVAAAAIAKQVVQHLFPNVEVLAWVEQVGNVSANVTDNSTDDLLTTANIERSAVRCPDAVASAAMATLIIEAKNFGDTLGGVVTARVVGVPVGWGEPVFDKCEALLAHAMLSLPATKGFEIGSGFGASKMTGSEHNDIFEFKDNRIQTKTNHSGGVQGGITNGMPIVFRVAFKPPSTIFREQQTLTNSGGQANSNVSDNREFQSVVYTATGRHDPCVVPRAVPIVEAMTWLVLCDLMLAQTIQERFHATL